MPVYPEVLFGAGALAIALTMIWTMIRASRRNRRDTNYGEARREPKKKLTS